jgi:hypothetical protein
VYPSECGKVIGKLDREKHYYDIIIRQRATLLNDMNNETHGERKKERKKLEASTVFNKTTMLHPKQTSLDILASRLDLNASTRSCSEGTSSAERKCEKLPLNRDSDIDY